MRTAESAAIILLGIFFLLAACSSTQQVDLAADVDRDGIVGFLGTCIHNYDGFKCCI